MGISLESDVMKQVIPGIEGKSEIPQWTNTEFTNLKSLTCEKTVAPKPDSYDGVLREEIHPQVQIDLNSMIMPSRVRPKAPAAPNFFLQVKGEDGTWKVARRQVCLNGAVGARAMHSLQNYGEAEPIYDGNAYTYSAAYHDCVLEVYAHHMTAPTPDSKGPEYHMTLLDVIPMHLSYEMYVKGVTAFRNARDMAKKHRDKFVKMANSTASQAEAEEEAAPEELGDANVDDSDSVNSDEHTSLDSHGHGHGQGSNPTSGSKRKLSPGSSEQSDGAPKSRTRRRNA